jgi:hypothetical protein
MGQQSNIKTLHLFMNPAALSHFDPVLQAGFFVRAAIQDSVRAYLSAQLGLPDQYINERISTVFLDGKPVDNIDSAIIMEGATLALSSAMPGLVGATMRRGGYYSGLRSAITYKEQGERKPEKEGVLRIKLFNLLLAQLGPIFLGRGVYMSVRELTGFLTRQPFDFFKACRKAMFDGEYLEVSSLACPGWCGDSEWVCLVATAQRPTEVEEE